MMQTTELIQRPQALPAIDSQPLVNSGRFDYIDLMRAIAITMVVAIHIASAYFYNGRRLSIIVSTCIFGLGLGALIGFSTLVLATTA